MALVPVLAQPLLALVPVLVQLLLVLVPVQVQSLPAPAQVLLRHTDLRYQEPAVHYILLLQAQAQLLPAPALQPALLPLPVPPAVQVLLRKYLPHQVQEPQRVLLQSLLVPVLLQAPLQLLPAPAWLPVFLKPLRLHRFSGQLPSPIQRRCDAQEPLPVPALLP